ncbi:MAG: nitroreductase family deazaflavin-dependent oxidoreductase [Segniliparus sp.]|uniref:nitroreductase family deazaflavin-dependent oxidoreductase n=1 Tax=Segniliparus sp. TaxID=2804064 RepID=UPI003F2E67D7
MSSAEQIGHGRTVFGSRAELAAFNDDVVAQLREHGGVVVEGLYAGAEQFLVLHTVGAKSGEPRQTPLYYLDVDGRWFLVGSFWGNKKHPAWVYNLRANPQVKVEVKGQSVEAVARELEQAEHARVWARLIEANPNFAEYQAKTDRRISLFELVR